jgi:hypothetical protein
MQSISLTLQNETFNIHRLPPDGKIPAAALDSPFFAVTRTEDELSIVVPETVAIKHTQSDSGWACFKVNGPLDFSLVGVLAGIANALANAKVSIFALSTFDTDYILVKRKQVEAAREALTSAGYLILA